ncbi:MAG: hypothetical protein EBR82_47700 [Caulobacteraceae bacterium]|nr:hypothetical protein [Caulobacteraceae bacterium]
MTIETAFGRWLRARPDLRSEDGINVFDEDHFCDRRVVHKFNENGDRSAQCYMTIEVKEYGAFPSDAQRSTFSILSGYLKNFFGNRNTRRGATRDIAGKRKKVWDAVFKRWVRVRHYGYHLLQFEKTSPEDSAWIKWDCKEITADQLVALLRFDIHPFTFQPLDARDRHKQKSFPLFLDVRE